MMHVHMIGLAVVIAIAVRRLNPPTVQEKLSPTTWQSRWHRAVTAFVVPPLFLLTTAVAIVVMGELSCHIWEGWLSYLTALLFVAFAVRIWAGLAWRAVKMQLEVRRYPQRTLHTQAGWVVGQVMPVSAVFSAQVGLWSSDLVVSEGLFSHLSSEQTEAVLAHESGHAHYRDTFWFFWLGGLRQLTGWLPYSELLWQELLLLREVRADLWAARSVDTLVLAESLMSVVTAPLMPTEAVCAGFSCAAPRSRLAQRVDALLAEEEGGIGSVSASFGLSPWQWAGLALALTPLLTIPFHHGWMINLTV